MAIRTANNQSLTEITALPSGVSGGSLVLIKELTASSSATLDFVNGASDVVLDSTYKEYIFKFINIHPEDNDVMLTFQGSIDTGSNYNVTMTTSFLNAHHAEGDGSAALAQITNRDQAQGTDFQKLNHDVGNANDEDTCGTFHLFDPSSTTFVKHFYSTFVGNGQAEDCMNDYVAGYFNTTSAIDAIQFKMTDGNIDAGTIKLYGVT